MGIRLAVDLFVFQGAPQPPCQHRARDLDDLPGQNLTLFDTPLGQIGILICYDVEVPLIAHALIAEGALDEAGWVVAAADLSAIAEVRRYGDVRNCLH